MGIWRSPTCFTMCRLLVNICVFIFWIGSILTVHLMAMPRKVGFFCDDDSIKYPYVESTISNDVIVSVTLVAPVVVIFLTELFARKFLSGFPLNNGAVTRRRGAKTITRNSSAQKDHPTVRKLVVVYLAYFWGYLALTLIVLVLKVSTGQLRPHFLAVCRPDVDWVTCRGYVSDYNCTNREVSERQMNSARQSFPSGHSAYALYMALFVILYMETRLKTHHCRLVRLTSHAALTLYALWCSMTRVSDHMHHMRDVMAGGLLGILLAGLTFTQGALHSLRGTASSQPSPHPHHHRNSHHDCQCQSKDTDSVHIDDSDNTNDNDDENDENCDTFASMEAPSTPTPLLGHGTGNNNNNNSSSSSSNFSINNPGHVADAGLKAGVPSFSLEGNKHKFARKAKSFDRW